MKHTPFKKTLLIGDECSGFVLSLHDKDGDNFANVKLFGSKEQCKANARLIVAAPELLQICKDVARLDVFKKDNYESFSEAIRNAIAKAEGRG